MGNKNCIVHLTPTQRAERTIERVLREKLPPVYYDKVTAKIHYNEHLRCALVDQVGERRFPILVNVPLYNSEGNMITTNDVRVHIQRTSEGVFVVLFILKETGLYFWMEENV